MQHTFSKYHKHACAGEYFLRVIPQSQKVAKPYSPLVKKMIWWQELFGSIPREQDNVDPSMQRFRLERNDQLYQKWNVDKISTTKHGVLDDFQFRGFNHSNSA
jgi:hypothetical protein